MERLSLIDFVLGVNSICCNLASISSEMNDLTTQFESVNLNDDDFRKINILIQEDIICHFHSIVSAIRSFDAMVELIRLSGGFYEKNW